MGSLRRFNQVRGRERERKKEKGKEEERKRGKANLTQSWCCLDEPQARRASSNCVQMSCMDGQEELATVSMWTSCMDRKDGQRHFK
jgi:hypothetical protein